MDESKAAISRKQRASVFPALEPLEGRRLMAAAVTQASIKELTEKGYTELEITGSKAGGSITINDNGSDSPGNVTVTSGNGSTYTSTGAISVIAFSGGKSNDSVTFNLTGDLTTAQSVLLNLGAGNDSFTGNIAGAIDSSSGLDLEVYGGAGNDNMVVNQTGATEVGAFVPYLEGSGGHNTMTYNGSGNIAAGASVTPESLGSGGTNNITTDYTGQDDGNFIYNLSANGGTGVNNIQYNVDLAPNSTGTIGTSSSTPAAIEAGNGSKDTIKFAVVDPTGTATVNAVVVNGKGKDVISTTSNVTVEGTGKKTTTSTVTS
jgi:hypothetical protein